MDFQPGPHQMVSIGAQSPVLEFSMIRPILQLGDPLLNAPARPIDRAELGAIAELARDMMETLAQVGGVGLAAPQVGESVRLILAGSSPTAANPDRPDVPTIALVNPRIISASAETEPGWEGCLSFLQYRVRVARHRSISVEYLTLDGQAARLDASGFYARVLQHEIDHLDGTLTLDRAESPDAIRPADAM